MSVQIIVRLNGAELPVELDADALAAIAAAATPAVDAREWFDVPAAASYLCIPKGRLYKLTSVRALAYHQEVEGGKLLFRRSDLDGYLAAHRVPARGET